MREEEKEIPYRLARGTELVVKMSNCSQNTIGVRMKTNAFFLTFHVFLSFLVFERMNIKKVHSLCL